MTCASCGAEAPAGAAFCPACGRRLGEPPAEGEVPAGQGEAPGRCPDYSQPPVVDVRIVDSPGRSCLSCLTWVMALFVLFVLGGLLAASC